MADVDYGGIKVYPGSYDDFMEASTLARQQLQKDNAKAKDRISDLEEFVRRFRAHKAKARQATSRMKMIEKLKVEDVKPSSRQYPFIRFQVDPKEKLHRLAVEVKGLSKSYSSSILLLKNLNFSVEAGEKIAIIGPNGIGKTTLLRCLAGDHEHEGSVKWAEKARVGYWAQDPADELNAEETLADWLGRWRRKDRPEQDDLIVRATLGQLLFSGDDQKKMLKVISGGEGQRMMIGKLVLQMPNVMLLDEPTNHLDMESIESLNLALENYPGTVIFVSHDREFVGSLATRIIELTPTGIIDFTGNYDDYLRSRGVVPEFKRTAT